MVNIPKYFLRRKFKQHMLSNYCNNEDSIISIQCCIRRFLSIRKLQKLKLNYQHLAASFIQTTFRNYSKNKKSKIITKFIRNVGCIRSYKLNKIKKNISARLITNFLKSKLTPPVSTILPPIPQTFNIHEISTEIPRVNTEIPRIRTYANIPSIQPTTLPNIQNSILTSNLETREAFENQRRFEERFLQHQREIDEQLRETRNTVARIENYVNERNQRANLNGSQTLNRLINENTRQRRILTNENNRAHRINTHQNNRENRTITNENRLRLPSINTDGERNPTSVLPRINDDNINRGITYQRRLDQIQEDLANPRLRDIYANNRIYINTPTGNARRILPENDRTLLVNEENGERNVLENIERKECLICLENRSKNLFTSENVFECDHSICLICLRDMIKTAVNNVTTNIPLKCPFFDNCGKYINPNDSLKELIPENTYKKFERYSLTKAHIPIQNLRYCPNSDCECPYELITDDISFPENSPRIIDYSYLLTCWSCNSSICTYCNTYWHDGISCHEHSQQRKQRQENESQNENLTSKYVDNYCKKCPSCNTIVQKLQNVEQEMHERITGLAGGTSECHHVTCSNCNTDFCWTCLQIYTGNEYYHRDCPNSDCIITFIGNYPQITHLPLGRINNIYLYTTDENNNITSRKMFSSNGFNRTEIITGIYPDSPSENSVIILCNSQGVVQKLRGYTGDYSFRQENKLINI